MHRVLAIAAFGACYSSAPPPAPQAPARPHVSPAAVADDPLAFLPGDAKFVGVVDVAKLRATPMWPIFVDQVNGRFRSAVANFKRECGFDMLDRVTQFTVGISDPQLPLTFVAVARGIPRAEFEACENRVFKRDVTIDHGVMHGPGFAMGFASPTALVMIGGTPDDLARSLASGAPLHGSADLQQLTAKLDPHVGTWLAFHDPKVLAQMSPPNVHIDSIAGTLDVSNGLVAELRIHVADAAEATQFTAKIQADLAKVRVFVEEVTVTADADEVVGHVVMTPGQVAGIVRMFLPPP